VGDQSSGKRSVLESLSGIALPHGQGIITRCPLVLRLHKIRADETEYAEIRAKEWFDRIDDFQVVEGLVKKYTEIVAGEGFGVSQDVIELNVYKYQVVDLMLINLPGEYLLEAGRQSN